MKSAPRMQPDNLLKQVISNDPDICSNDSFAFVNHVSKSLIEKVQQLMSTPQFIPVGRIVRVTNGNANYKVNMLPVDLMSGDVLIIPENSYLEINSFSTDFDVQFISFKNLPVTYSRPTSNHQNAPRRQRFPACRQVFRTHLGGDPQAFFLDADSRVSAFSRNE